LLFAKLGTKIRWPMARTRTVHVKRVRKIARVGNGGAVNVTRAEFNDVIAALNERGETIRRELQTQFARIAQLQQELDALKRRT
jgi:hypothetical protein